MSSDPPQGNRSFLGRWSQRKVAAARELARAGDASKAPEAPQPAVAMQPVAASQPAVAASSLPAPSPEVAPVPALPPVDALTFDSDFSAFLAPQVDASLRRQALRRLFSDPRFNVMDGLDVYIDDYTKFEPIPVDVIAQLRHAKAVLDPPRTRVNAQGHVEDVPPEEEAVAADEAEGGSVAAQAPSADNDAQIAAAGIPAPQPTAPVPAAATTAQEAPSDMAVAEQDADPSAPAGGEGRR